MARQLTLKQAQAMARPSGYARHRLGLALHKWQKRVVDSLFMAHTKAAISTCNESGKTSYLIASLVLWHMECFPGSMTVTTSASNKQIKFQLYPALKRYCARLGRGWKVRSSSEHSISAPNGSNCVSYSTDDEYMSEGFHEWETGDFMEGFVPPEDWDMPEGWTYDKKAPLLMIMDECKGISDARFDAFDRCRPTRVLYASSPGDPRGRFYDLFHRFSPLFEVEGQSDPNLWFISAYECPHLMNDAHKADDIETQIAIRGESDAFVQSSVFGQFAESGMNMVFDMVKVDAAMSGMLRQHDEGTVRAAVDLSGGGDEQCLYLRRGNRAELIGSWHERDYNTLVSELTIKFDKHELKPHWIRADRGGLGDPICTMLDNHGWAVERMDFGAHPKNHNKYGNARSEMYFELAQNIAQGHIILPRDDELREQLAWQKYVMDEQQRLWIEPKAKMPRSPDRADTIAMLFYGMAGVQDLMRDERRHRRRLSPSLPETPRTGFAMQEEFDEQEALFF